MRQSTENIATAQKQILAYNGHYLSVPVKVAKTTTTVDVNNVLLAGTIIDSTGKVVNDAANGSTAFGVVYEDIDFTNSKGTEIVPVIVHGFIKASALPAAPVAEVKAALKMIQFM